MPVLAGVHPEGETMTVSEKIQGELQKLPEHLQREVLTFVEYLQSRAAEDSGNGEDDAWSAMSLLAAVRGMEDENGPEYAIKDFKESFA